MARSEMGNFAQRLDTPFCVVICGVLGTVADELTLPASTTNSLSSPVTNPLAQIGDANDLRRAFLQQVQLLIYTLEFRHISTSIDLRPENRDEPPYCREIA